MTAGRKTTETATAENAATVTDADGAPIAPDADGVTTLPVDAGDEPTGDDAEPADPPEKVKPRRYSGPKVGSVATRDYYAQLNADGSLGEISETAPEGYGVQLALKGSQVTPELARALGDDTAAKPLGA